MKKIYFLVSMVFMCIALQAQTPLKHASKIYRSPEGKLYVQKSLPLYLYVSTEPNQKGTMHQLHSDSTKAFADPMYLDTEGYNTFRSPSAVDTVTKEIHFPIMDVVFELYADSRPPATKLKYDASKKYFDGQNLFVGKGLLLELECSDEMSGLEQVLVSIDSAAYQPYQKPIEFNQEKVYSISYYSVDNVGNTEPVQGKIFHVDLTPPVSELIFDGEKSENHISGRTKLVLKATDGISGLDAIYYSIDGKEYRKYYQNLYAANYVEGEHTISYYSVDKTGNEETKKEYAFYVDKTPPILVDEIMGNSFVVNGREYSSGRTKLKLTAVDNKSGVKEIKYSINNEEYQVYDKPFYLTNVSGSLSVVSFAVDQVGNRSMAGEKSTKSRAAFVDLSGPQLKYDFIGKVFKTRDTAFVNLNTKISLSATDAESGFKALSYSINSGSEIPYTKPFSITEQGPYVLNIYGYDNVDNSNREELNIVVDNDGPDIFTRFSILPLGKKEVSGQSVDVYSSQAVLFLSATDSKVAIDRIYYTIKGETEKIYTGIIEGFKRGKDYEIAIKALDKLGNINIDTVLFATDNTGPEIFTRFSIHPNTKEIIDGAEVDVYPSHVSLFLSVTNATVAYDKIYYSINGSKEMIYQGIIGDFKPDTLIKMKVRAIDRLGNETDKIIVFKTEE